MSIEQDRPLNLVSGWNIIGFTCNEPIDVVDAFLPIVDKVIIAKDNNGGAYLPEFGFNGIGGFEYGYGYQLKLTDAITDFQFCPFLVPLVEGCMDETAFNYNSNANLDDGSCYPFIYGCIDPSAFNFNDYDFDGQTNYFTGLNGIDINTDDGSCFAVILGCLDIGAYNYNDYDGDGVANELTGINGVDVNTEDGSCVPFIYGCTDSLACNFNPEANMAEGSCEYADLGYDCDGNITEYFIGMEAEGGIVFYVDETGEHGLVAALEDLTYGATYDNSGNPEYEWGCWGEDVNGADGTAIGTGYQNTMDIVNQGCSTENGGITAAQAALDAEINGYNDWYLPSIDELVEMYNTIGNGGPEGNIGGFEIGENGFWTYYYRSSSEFINSTYYRHAWFVGFDIGLPYNYFYKSATLRVRVIRSF